MWVLIIALPVIACVALLLGYFRNTSLRRKIARGELSRMPEVKEVDVACCGQHQTCEKESLLAAVSKKIEYYDDDELDQFKGVPSGAYTLAQVDAFRDIFYTMQETDVAGWIRSLQLRGIELPDEMKDEVFLVVGELRFG